MNKLSFLIAAVVLLTAAVLSAAAVAPEPAAPPATASPAPAAGKSPQSGDTRAGADDYTILWYVVAAGGTNSTSDNYRLRGTAAQTAVGEVQSPLYRVHQGFWQNLVAPCLAGDADGSSSVTISDAVYLINYIFAGGRPPVTACGGDPDGNGMITVSDVVFLTRYIFLY